METPPCCFVASAHPVLCRGAKTVGFGGLNYVRYDMTEVATLHKTTVFQSAQLRSPNM